MYFITTFDSKDGDTRCVGYVSTFEKAEQIVLNNTCDIWETCYDYAVIEKIPEGLYQYDEHPKWYKWDNLEMKYKKIGRAPACVGKHFAGFAIG